MIEPGRSQQLFDVTVRLSDRTPVWPGDPQVAIEPIARIAHGDVINLSQLRCSSHAGTHVDAPWHFDDRGFKLDEIPLDRWIGPCWVAEIPDGVTRIEPDHLESAAIPPETSRLLLRTSNSSLWQADQVEFDEQYVALSPAAARWLLARGTQLIGIDYLSIEPFDDDSHEAHHTLLDNGILIVENLNLTAVDAGPYTLLCLPLRLAAGDGAPAWVVLVRDSPLVPDP